MKNLFSLNATAPDTVEFDENPYLAAHVSEEVHAMLKNAFTLPEQEAGQKPVLSDETQAAIRQSSRAWGLCLGCFVGALLCMAIGEGTGLFTRYPLLHLTDLALFVAGVVCNFRARRLDRRTKAIREEGTRTDFTEAAERLQKASRLAAEELGVPGHAVNLEILPIHYRVVDGQSRPAGKKNRFDNIAVSAWVEGESLCMTTAQQRFDVPLSAIRGLRVVDETFEVDYWLKAEDSDSDTYAAYSIHRVGFMGRKCRPYYALELAPATDGGEAYEFFIPCYDRPVLEGLCDVRELS